ncbi:co-chaperone GroES [Sphingomonas melonis]|uniref:10 kDa chaperonin n=1 Tax=Sphingomonas melonis TaxID=152682 RepID=A0A7Y9K1B9_9SPHN|nr:co-chaperone GroES family protein [Sphingomonas melonis]NYD88759.1 co-chaperonin GroES (HSP10) [Sphingomonas melonis]
MGTIPSLNDCRPGIKPVEYYVLIAPETTEERTAGGIYIPQAKRETDEIATQRGRIVAQSPLAWGFADGDAHRGKVGDVVLFGRYAGSLIEGVDGKTYRLCRDKDVAGIYEENAS